MAAMKGVSILGIVLMILVTSCGYQEGVRQVDTQSFFRFVGEVSGATVSIDGGAPIQIDITETVGEGRRGQGRKLFLVTAGKHEVIVRKDEKTVVHRNVLINAGSTKEIYVP